MFEFYFDEFLRESIGIFTKFFSFVGIAFISLHFLEWLENKVNRKKRIVFPLNDEERIKYNSDNEAYYQKWHMLLHLSFFCLIVVVAYIFIKFVLVFFKCGNIGDVVTEMEK